MFFLCIIVLLVLAVAVGSQNDAVISVNYLIAKTEMTIASLIAIAVGLGVFFMIMLNVTHPPAGGNPIIVIIGSASFDYLLSPVITGSIIIIIFGVVLNKFILKKNYPK